MPAFESMDLEDTAVLWPAVGVDLYGEYVVGPPQEISCRWVASRNQMMDPSRRTETIDATVIVDIEIPIGSRMWLGSLVDVPGTAVVPDEDWMEVKYFDSTSDLKGRDVRRSVKLMRYRSLNA